MERSPRETRHKLPRVLYQWSPQDWLIPPALSCDNLCDTFSQLLVTGKLSRDTAPKAFTGGSSCRRPLPSTYPNLIPRRKVTVQHKSYCVHKCTVNHPHKSGKVLYQCRELFTSHVLDISEEAPWQAGLSKESSFGPAVLTLNCMQGITFK